MAALRTGDTRASIANVEEIGALLNELRSAGAPTDLLRRLVRTVDAHVTSIATQRDDDASAAAPTTEGDGRYSLPPSFDKCLERAHAISLMLPSRAMAIEAAALHALMLDVSWECFVSPASQDDAPATADALFKRLASADRSYQQLVANLLPRISGVAAGTMEERLSFYLEDALSFFVASGGTEEEIASLTRFVCGRPAPAVEKAAGELLFSIATVCQLHQVDMLMEAVGALIVRLDSLDLRDVAPPF